MQIWDGGVRIYNASFPLTRTRSLCRNDAMEKEERMRPASIDGVSPSISLNHIFPLLVMQWEDEVRGETPQTARQKGVCSLFNLHRYG